MIDTKTNKTMNLLNVKGLNTVNYLSNKGGKFRFIIKPKAGFMTCLDSQDFENERYNLYPDTLLTGYKKGVIQSIEYKKPGSEFFSTVFAKKGKNIIIADRLILETLQVGIVNNYFFGSNVYEAQSNMSRFTDEKRTWASLSLVLPSAELV